MKSGLRLIDMITRLVASGIFAYSAFMKFTAAPTAVYIFRRIGMDPAGRYGVALLECITIILLLIPKTAWRGAILGGLMMFGAICMHLTIGEVNIKPNGAGVGDGGLMFASACVVLLCCISVLVIHKTELETELN
ncbi:MAG: DoxX family protein [Bacteroidota bacterium]|nr:DoxX family protein [Bacteroidota bacterium]